MLKAHVFADGFQIPELRKALQREIGSPRSTSRPRHDLLKARTDDNGVTKATIR
jgi:hypothetical protein